MGSSKLSRSKLGLRSHISANIVISARNLMNLKKKAIRRGLRYKSIRHIDRVLIDLTIKVSSNIYSGTLIKSLLTVAEKLHVAFESKLERATRTIGFSLAQKISLLARNWQCEAADAWATDQKFARYLAMMTFQKSVI